MRDNYFSSYGKTKFIVDNYKKLGRVSLIFASIVLILPVFFISLNFLGNVANIIKESTQSQAEILGAQEKTVSAEVEFAEAIAVGKTVSIEERSRILKKTSSEVQSGDRRELVLRAYLETMRCWDGSIPPIADYTKELVQAADKYGLDWRYSTAIAGVETWFGCAGDADGYKNAWGYGGGPATRFHYRSWPEGIDAYTKGFVEGYGTKIDFYLIASYYTRGLAGRNDPWANGVTRYLAGIDAINKELL